MRSNYRSATKKIPCDIIVIRAEKNSTLWFGSNIRAVS